MLLPSLSLDELRERVREAEALLRVARQHARDAHDDPAQSEHASARIQSICREVEALFPGLHAPSAPDPAMAEALAALQVAASAGHTGQGVAGGGEEAEGRDAAEDGEGDDGETGDGETEDDETETEDAEEDAEAEDADGWDIDHAKLAAAIENEHLMSQFPEPGRSAFKKAAQYLVESHQRQELFQRVVDGFEEVSDLAKQNMEELRHKLAVALTLEQLASKNKG